jgi:hypothetical protein
VVTIIWSGPDMAKPSLNAVTVTCGVVKKCGDNHLEPGRHTAKPTVIVAIITCGTANTYKSLL